MINKEKMSIEQRIGGMKSVTERTVEASSLFWVKEYMLDNVETFTGISKLLN